jgi:hypothetical protein
MENKENDLVKLAAGIIVASVAIPIVVGTVSGGVMIIQKLSNKHKIKKGLKNGTIIERYGQYYEVDTTGEV